MAIYSFVPPFHEAKFYGVPSCIFDKLGCAAGEKSCGTLFFYRSVLILWYWWNRAWQIYELCVREGTYWLNGKFLLFRRDGVSISYTAICLSHFDVCLAIT
jgi:hypothetical protein